jgi:hypothetical protein
VTRQFAGPSNDPDRYELVERRGPAGAYSERWYATRWVADRHVAHEIVVTRGRAYGHTAVPDPRSRAAAHEEFAGPIPHEWGRANGATIAWYDVTSLEPMPKAGVAPPSGPRSRRHLLAGAAAAVGIVLLSVAVALVARDGAPDESVDAATGSVTPATTSIAVAPTTVPSTTPPTTTTLVAPTVDPSQDARGADLVSSTAEARGAALVIDVHFSASTFSAASLVTLIIDVDEDPATGLPGVDSLCSYDPGSMGTEFIVQAGGQRIHRAAIYRAGASCNQFEFVAEVPMRALTDGYHLAVPLSVLRDEGNVNYKVTSATEVSPGVSDGINDVMPDVGLPPASSRPSTDLTKPG